MNKDACIMGYKTFNLLTLTFFICCSPCHAQQPYYACMLNSGLLKIDLSTCNATLIGYTDTVLCDIALCSDQKLYGTDLNFLYQIDTSDAGLTAIGQLNLIALGNSLVCDSAGNLLSVAMDDNLYQINRLTGQYSSLGGIGYSSAGDLTFFEGNLYLSATDNKLIKIDLPSVTTQEIGIMNASSIFGINTVCYDDQETMIASGGNASYSHLYQVNTANASLNLLCNTITHDLIFGAASLLEVHSTSPGCTSVKTGVLNIINHAISISPNPVIDFVTIQINTSALTEVLFYNLSLEQIKKIQFTNSARIDFREFPSGIYIYEVRNSRFTERGKIIKQ